MKMIKIIYKFYLDMLEDTQGVLKGGK